MSDSEINEEKPKNEIKSDSSPPTPKDVENQKFDLKGEDNCLYTILIKKDEDSLFIQAFDKEKIERNDYKIKLSKDDFFKINKVFKQCDNIEEISELAAIIRNSYRDSSCIRITTENILVAERIYRLISKTYDVQPK